MEALQKRLAENLARIDDELCELRSRHDRNAEKTAATAALSAIEQQQVGLLHVCVWLEDELLAAIVCCAFCGGRGAGAGSGGRRVYPPFVGGVQYG